MEFSEYRDKYSDIEWEISKVNQYAIDLYIEEHTFRIPVRRDTFVGDVAYLPRDRDFNKKKILNLILRFDTDYLPVKSPDASIEEAGKNEIRISYTG